MRRQALAAAMVATVLIVASGCGGTSRYDFEASRTCLRDEASVEVRRPPQSDFVASTALGGALNVKFPDNQVTVAFGEDEAEAGRLATAYRRFRGKNIGIENALEQEKNVVLLWGVHPAAADSTLVRHCLKG